MCFQSISNPRSRPKSRIMFKRTSPKNKQLGKAMVSPVLIKHQVVETYGVREAQLHSVLT
jgi:hypothetical protein